MLKRLIRPLVPKKLLSAYHYALAVFAAFIYRYPSEKMVVIGVTGTSGKSTVCYMLARAIEDLGEKVGLASTIYFKVGDKEWLNDKKMTMVGRFQLQSLLKQMVEAGCKYAIVETTSEGIVQSRHRGVHYDVCAFTNLYPEHIESHGGFENYKAAKLQLFKKLEHDKHKVIEGKKIDKVIIVNSDDGHSKDFLAFDVDKKIEVSPSREKIELSMLGEHNKINALLALHVGLALGFNRAKLEKSLFEIKSIPGRLELIDEGQDFTVIVDYAFEPKALGALYKAIESVDHKKVIHVTGAAGGGRDVKRRSSVGMLVATHSDVMIVTNEDPYDEDPQKIIDEVAVGAKQVQVSVRAKVIKIIDRGEAIAKAISIAQAGDLVLITGKGSEQALVIENNKLIPWDDREEARKAIKNL